MYGRLTSLPTGSRFHNFGSLVRLPYTNLKSALGIESSLSLNPNSCLLNP